MKRHTAPIVAAVLLLLPVLYVGSYLALVVPQGRMVMETKPNIHFKIYQYRFGGEFPHYFYWPLQQIDRKVRPAAWVPYPSTDPRRQAPTPDASDVIKGGVI
jgi:hypothetical protein